MKKTKASVNYRDATSATRCCKTCEYSYGPEVYRRCKIVEGRIYPDDVCDKWEKPDDNKFGSMDIDDAA